jgi:hypothetical protein
MIPNSTFKEKIQALLSDLRNWVFPPICPVCSGFCETKLFCSTCWERSALIIPEERCLHCFGEGNQICGRCRRKPSLVFPRSYLFEKGEAPLYLVQKSPEILPSFLVVQWARLKWRFPDVVISMPKARSLAISFSEMIQIPYIDALHYDTAWKCDAEAIEEDSVLLLIDIDSSLENLQGAIQALSNAFPKKGYVLSVFGRED